MLRCSEILFFLAYTILTEIPESRCACPATWIAGPSSKFPGCFKAWNGTGGRTGGDIDNQKSSYYWYRSIGLQRTYVAFDTNLWNGGVLDGRGSGSYLPACVSFTSKTAAMDDGCLVANTLVCHIYDTTAIAAAIPVNNNGAETAVINGVSYYYFHFNRLFASVPEAAAACRTIHPDATLFANPISAYISVLQYIIILQPSKPLYLNWDVPLNVYRDGLNKSFSSRNVSIKYSNWFPGYPDYNDTSKKCVTANPIDDYMWRNVPCDNRTLFAICQLVCTNQS
uniref:C-type lectin domain-containing protein n=1 Tax=Romanomermis culicivorax TaxID=13658 RepID=A0A915KEG5_ROMCU